MRVSIFNYGSGNLYSIRAALQKEGVKSVLTKNESGAEDADALILPGVGAFSPAATRLPMEAIRGMARSGKPILGICLGLQLLFSSSEEGPGEGLSLLPGRVSRLPATVKVPQVGWNTIAVKRAGSLVEGLPSDPWVYYVNSYYPAATGSWVTATTDYGVEFPCVVEDRNIFGTQFHPEKSGPAGRTILRNFIQLVKR